MKLIKYSKTCYFIDDDNGHQLSNYYPGNKTFYFNADESYTAEQLKEIIKLVEDIKDDN